MLYQENAYRILGVSADASVTMVRDAFQSLRTRIKVGSNINIKDPLCSVCSLEQSESKIRDAFNRLMNPKTRLEERLLWFTKSLHTDEKALALLLSKDTEGAIRIWKSIQNHTSIANLTRLYHANCIYKDPDAEDCNLWEKTLGDWCTTIKSEGFWGGIYRN